MRRVRRSSTSTRFETRSERGPLLDVNLLVALFDPNHVFYDLAHDWFSDSRGDGWATCALTENAFVRILSNPAYRGSAMRPPELGS
jgi:predicted nucleic acid-binding protein